MRQRRRPSAPWLVASVAVLIASILASTLLARAVDDVNRDRFAVAVDGFESGVGDLIDAMRLIGVIIPTVMSPDGGGVSLDRVTSILGGSDGGDPSAMVNQFGVLPLDGLAGFGFVSYADGDEEPIMLPNGYGLSTESLGLAGVAKSLVHTRDSGRTSVSDPITSARSPLYAYTFEIIPDLIGVQFVDPAALVAGPAERGGSVLLDIVATDGPTGTVVAVTGDPTSGTPAQRRIEASMLGRELLLDVRPGAAFEWQTSWVPAVAALSLGVAVAVMIFIAGVISRRRVEAEHERLEMARRINEDKDRFIAAVSHELRTPLTSVVGLADELSARIGMFDRDQVVELVGIVAQESHEMALLVEDLLVAARAEEGTVYVRSQTLDVDQEIAHVCRGLGEIAAAVRIVPSSAGVWADPLRFRQIVRNLIMNALRHGGPNVEVEVHRSDESTAVEIRDDGLGVHGESRMRMFEPYYRSAVVRGQAPSVGLGLSVAHSLAKAMGGVVRYRYDEGWSVFRLVLPAAEIEVSSPSLRAS